MQKRRFSIMAKRLVLSEFAWKEDRRYLCGKPIFAYTLQEIGHTETGRRNAKVGGWMIKHLQNEIIDGVEEWLCEEQGEMNEA